MTTAAANNATGTAAWADALLLSFAQAGYRRAEPAIIQPPDPFLDLSGEDIRKSLYLTTDPTGEELCLRPDLTIPVARGYRGGRGSEFLQAGIESFGRPDRAAADAEMLALALEATAAFGLSDVEIRTGDVALFNALIDALGLYPVWRRRLVKDFNRKVSLIQDIERLTLATAPGRNEYEGVLAALAGSDRKAALALVTDLMSIAGATNVGGRMLGTSAAFLTTNVIAPMIGAKSTFDSVAVAAGVVGTAVFAIALIATFFLPEPQSENALDRDEVPNHSPTARV